MPKRTPPQDRHNAFGDPRAGACPPGAHARRGRVAERPKWPQKLHFDASLLWTLVGASLRTSVSHAQCPQPMGPRVAQCRALRGRQGPGEAVQRRTFGIGRADLRGVLKPMAVPHKVLPIDTHPEQRMTGGQWGGGGLWGALGPSVAEPSVWPPQTPGARAQAGPRAMAPAQGRRAQSAGRAPGPPQPQGPGAV